MDELGRVTVDHQDGFYDDSGIEGEMGLFLRAH